MRKIRIKFLGTANAIPTKLRNHTAILLSYNNENILIDCGEGTQRQFRFANESPLKLTRILITHWHGDHILGIPGLLQTLAMSDYKKVLKIYGPPGTKRYFEFLEKIMLGMKINIEIHEVSSGIVIDEPDFYVEAAQMQHGIPCNAYSFVLKDRLRMDKAKLKKYKLPNSPLVGELQKGKDIVYNKKKIKSNDVTFLEKGKKISFVFDTLYNENAVRISKDADVLVAESSFLSAEEKKADERWHLTASDAANIARKANAKKLFLTHISQRYEHKIKSVEKEAKKVFRKTALVKDFDEIQV